MEHDLHNNVNAVKVLAPVAIATDTTTVGAIIDTAGYESIEFILSSGVVTDGAYTTVLEDGDDSGLSDAAAIDSTLLLGALPPYALSEDGVTKRVGTITKKRYVRLSIVSTAVTTGGLFSVVAVQGHPHSMPVA